MEWIAGFDPLVPVQVDPALAAGGFRPRIPTDAQRLIATAGERDQILLYRLDAEDERDFVLLGGPRRSFGSDDERIAPSPEPGGDAVADELGVAEIAKDRSLA